MKKPLKILAALFGVFVMVLVVAAVLVWLLFDPNDYKDEIAAWVKQRTGRDLVIGDDLKLALFPWLAVQTGEISLSNAADFGDEPFATLDEIDVRLRLWPLLRKRLEAGTLVLSGLRLNLVRGVDGQGNWDDLLGPPATEAAAGPGEEAGKSPLSALVIAGLKIRDGAIIWDELATERRYIVRDLAVDTGRIVTGEPVDLKVGFTAVHVEPQFVATIELQGTGLPDFEQQRFRIDDLELTMGLEDGRHNPRARGIVEGDFEAEFERSAYRFDGARFAATLIDAPIGPETIDISGSWSEAHLDLIGQRLEVTDLHAESRDLEITAEVQVAGLLSSPELHGTLRSADGSVLALTELLSIALPAGVQGDALGRLELETEFTAQLDPLRLKLSGLAGRIADLRVAGELAFEGGPARRATGRLQIPESPAAGVFTALGEALPAEIDTTHIETVALDTAFALDLEQGKLSLSETKAQLLGASLELDAHITDLGDSPRYAGSVRIPAFASEQFAMAFQPLLPTDVGAAELGVLALDTGFELDTEQNTLALTDLTAQAFGLRVRGELSARELDTSRGFTSRLRVEPFSPRALLTRFGREPPVTTDPKVLGTAVIDTRLAGSSGSLQFENLTLKLDDATITGRFAVENFDDPAYAFDLAIDRVDVDRYLPPPGETSVTDEAGSDVEIPSQQIRFLDLAGRLRVGQIKIGGLRLAELDTNLEARDGVARMASARAALYGGSFDGRASADARTSLPILSIDGRATNVQLAALLRDLYGEGRLTGTGTFELSLNGRGGTFVQNLQTAEGKVGFALRDGEIQGLNLGYALCTTYNAIKKVPQPDRNVPRATRFDEMSGTAVVIEGIARTSNLLATNPYMKVTGTGNLDLPAQRLSYALDAQLKDSIDIRGCESMDQLIGESIPVQVAGPVNDPTIRPDYDAILKRLVEREIKKKLGDELLKVLGGENQSQ